MHKQQSNQIYIVIWTLFRMKHARVRSLVFFLLLLFSERSKTIYSYFALLLIKSWIFPNFQGGGRAVRRFHVSCVTGASN